MIAHVYHVSLTDVYRYSVMKPEVTLASGRKYLDSYGHFVPRPKYVCKALVEHNKNGSTMDQ